MPWCPKCGSEYRPEFDTCADCGTALVEELPSLSGEPIKSQLRESLLTGAQSFSVACLAIATVIGLFFTDPYLTQYGSLHWELVFLSLAAPISGTLGFLLGRFRRRQLRLLPTIIGWGIPWMGLCAYMLRISGWDWQQLLGPGLSDLVVWFALMTTAAVAGISGTLIGGQWKHRHDWLRMIAFCTVLAALAYFWTAILHFTQVAH